MQHIDSQPLSFLKRSAFRLGLYISLFIISWIHASTDPPHDHTTINIQTTFDKFSSTYPLNTSGFKIRFGFSKLDPITFPLHFANDIWPMLNPKTYISPPRQHYATELASRTLQEPTTPVPIIPTAPCSGYVTARHIEGGGIGYNYGYSTLESMLLPLRSPTSIWPFIDLRAHRFDNNEYAANGGLGIRCLLKEKTILGLNSYFDYRTDQSRRLYFMQLGAGLEILTPPMDIRINAYLPRHTNGLAQKCIYDQYIGGYVMVRKKIETPLEGADAEIGRYLFDFRHFELYGATGAYYYRDICQNVFGGKLRANARIFNYLTLDYMMTCDPLFGTKIQGQVGLTFQFGCRSNKSQLEKKLSGPVRRNEIIVLDQYCRWSTNF